MSVRKAAIINISKGLLNVSLTTLGAIAGATGNPLIAGSVAFVQTTLASDVLKPLIEKSPQELLALPIPPWWTGEPQLQTWQSICSEVENRLPEILSGVEKQLSEKSRRQNAGYLSSNDIKHIFAEQISLHISSWEVSSQDRDLAANYITPPLLEKTANVLKGAIDNTRQDALAQWMIHIADKLDGIQKTTSAINGTSQVGQLRSVASETLEKKWLQEAYDVYMCYDDDDEAKVMEIGEKLKEQGILPWFDKLDMKPGELKMRQQEVQIQKIPTAAAFIGQQRTITGWRELQMYSFIGQFIKRGLPVIPVILPNAPEKLELPPYLDNFTPVDFHRSLPDPLEQLVKKIIEKQP